MKMPVGRAAHQRENLRIIASPAFKAREVNPYTSCLYEQLVTLGVRVQERTAKAVFVEPGIDIWHVHWPEGALKDASTPKAIYKLAKFLLQIYWAKLRGIRLIWTVHNLGSHQRQHPWLEQWFWRVFLAHVDGLICLNNTGRDLALARFPALEDVPAFVIPHGHFRGLYPDTVSREQARAQLGLEEDQRVALFLGQIWSYKNVPQLLQVFRQLPGIDNRLVIAGRPRDNQLKAEIEQAVLQDARVTAHLEHVPSASMQLYLKAADLVVLPYEEILNSGAALLALSFDRPVLVPDKGSLRELQAQVGSEWVRLYDNALNATVLQQALAWSDSERAQRPDLDAYDWTRIAQSTLEAYQQVASPHA